MAKQQVGEIRISKRIVRIGHQDYPLANISRVQSLRLVWGGKLGTYYPLRRIVIVLVAVVVVLAAVSVLPDVVPAVDADAQRVARQVAAVVAALAAIRIAYLLVLLGYRVLVRKPRYALVLETAGTQYTALTGTDHHEIQRIKNEIVAAIEDPPATERIVHIAGDVVMGDQYKQSGSDSRMTVNK